MQVLKAWRRWVEPWYLAYALMGATVGGIVPIVLPIAVYRASGAVHTGLVFAAFNLGGLAAPLWGRMADRRRVHRHLALAGALLVAFPLAAFPVATTPAVWVGLALLQGIGASGAATMANAYILERHPEDEWEERIGWLQTFYGSGQVVGLLLTAALTQTHLSISLLMAAGLAGLAAVIGWLTMRAPACSLTLKAPLGYPPISGEWPTGSPQHLFHHLAADALHWVRQGARSSFTLLLGSWLLTFVGSWTFFSQFPVLMAQVFAVSPWMVSSASAVAHALGLALYVPAGYLSERYGPMRVLTWGLSVRLLAFTSLFALGGASFAGRGWVAVACMSVVVLSWSLLSVSGTALMARLSAGGEGEGIGLFNAATALAGVTGAALGGWAAERWGYQTALILPVAAVGCGLLLTSALRRTDSAQRLLKSMAGGGLV
jgi:DHA1 family tetracycline resistance protein-like MFS transporter